MPSLVIAAEKVQRKGDFFWKDQGKSFILSDGLGKLSVFSEESQSD